MKQAVMKHFIIAGLSSAVLFLLMYIKVVQPEFSSSIGSTFPHYFIHSFLLIGLPLGIFTDAVQRLLQLKRPHTLLTKLGLYLAIVYVSWESAAGFAAGLLIYFLIECAFFSVSRTKENTFSM
ncbi:hypothetical protein ACQGRJ_04985 [Bacillus atrophaeus]|uniref:hypothetical protein n=1 Tax=Bacillus atrophaeus TaxID=1452 RepID=UPI003CFB5822